MKMTAETPFSITMEEDEMIESSNQITAAIEKEELKEEEKLIPSKKAQKYSHEILQASKDLYASHKFYAQASETLLQAVCLSLDKGYLVGLMSNILSSASFTVIVVEMVAGHG